MRKGQAIKELKEQYPGEWLAIRVLKREESQPVEGELAYHSKDKREVWANLPRGGRGRIYVTYAGPLIEEGYAVAFHAL